MRTPKRKRSRNADWAYLGSCAQATVALMNGLVFASYHFLLKLQLPTADTVPTLAQIALAGAGCGIVSS